jgi:hypothetical protein
MDTDRINRTPGQTPAIVRIPLIDTFQFLDQPMTSAAIPFGLVLESDRSAILTVGVVAGPRLEGRLRYCGTSVAVKLCGF